jgi:hypothetical protein
MKVSSRVYKGIYYVEFTDLPSVQQERFKQSNFDSLFIKILIDKRIVGKCIQYKDYENWFDTVYRGHSKPVPPAPVEAQSFSLSNA